MYSYAVHMFGASVNPPDWFAPWRVLASFSAAEGRESLQDLPLKSCLFSAVLRVHISGTHLPASRVPLNAIRMGTREFMFVPGGAFPEALQGCLEGYEKCSISPGT